MKQKNQVFS